LAQFTSTGTVRKFEVGGRLELGSH
jgi:hypothetical protein